MRSFLALGNTWHLIRCTEELAQFRPWFLECLESSPQAHHTNAIQIIHEFLRIDLLGYFSLYQKKAEADLNPEKMGCFIFKDLFCFVKDIILIHLAKEEYKTQPRDLRDLPPRRQAWANRSVRKLRPASSRRCRCRCRWFPAKIYRSRRSLGRLLPGGFVGEMVREKMSRCRFINVLEDGILNVTGVVVIVMFIFLYSNWFVCTFTAYQDESCNLVLYTLRGFWCHLQRSALNLWLYVSYVVVV